MERDPAPDPDADGGDLVLGRAAVGGGLLLRPRHPDADAARPALAPDLELPPETHNPLVADDSNVCYLNADTSGLFIPEIEHWTAVGHEQMLGRIVSPYKGETLSEVRSPARGILFTLREYPLVYEGSLMARIVDVTVAAGPNPEGPP